MNESTKSSSLATPLAPATSYEKQLATVEAMMSCYDTPLTQTAGYVRDLLRTIITLRKREMLDDADDEVERILAMTDEEVTAEAGGPEELEKQANHLRGILKKAIAQVDDEAKIVEEMCAAYTACPGWHDSGSFSPMLSALRLPRNTSASRSGKSLKPSHWQNKAAYTAIL
jgi:hypothetical protein